MRNRQLPKLLMAAAVVAALAPAMTSTAAGSAGSIALRDPVSQAAYASHVPFSWDFTHGTKVTSTSRLYLQASNDGYRWFPIDTQVPIRNGAYLWDTSGWAEGAYDLRSVVHGTLIMDKVGSVVVDRTAPLARISNPSEGDVIVEDIASVSNAVVVGTTTLEAETYDFGSGVEEIAWSLDGEEIGLGSPYEYNFSMTPGPHVLTVTATDVAGNETEHSINLIAGPGPSLVAQEIPDTGELPEPGEPPVDPEELPLPDLSEVPDPSQLPLPDPNELPEPPDAGELPADPNNPPAPPSPPVDPNNPPALPAP